MRQLFFALGILGTAFSVGCGSGGHGQIVVPKGNFSNASLSGSYVYQIAGKDFTTNNNPTGLPYRESGVLTADGNGHITTGTDDFVEGTGGPKPPAGITGTYSIGNDGIGTVSLSTGLNFFITLVGSSKAYLIEADAGLNASGLVEKQDTTAITSIPNGTFAFHLHTLSASSLPSARVGVMTVTNASVTGNEDRNDNGIFTTQTMITSGFFKMPSAGRGDANLNDGSGSVNFKYYIVDANNIRFLASDLGFVGSGSAEKQNGTLVLSGSYAFGSKGDTNNFGIGGVNSVGRFTSDSANAITGGVLDSVQDGNQTLASNFSGNFTPVDIRGRTVLTLSGASTVTEVVYVVSPSRGFFLINDPNKVEDGTLDLQQTSPFSNSTLSGQFAFVNDGFDTNPDFIDRVGTMNWDGNGNMTFHEAVNSGLNGGTGAQLLGFFSATYSVASNGRATATISNVSLTNNDFVFYLVSGNDAYILENDAGVEISGVASKQQ